MVPLLMAKDPPPPTPPPPVVGSAGSALEQLGAVTGEGGSECWWKGLVVTAVDDKMVVAMEEACDGAGTMVRASNGIWSAVWWCWWCGTVVGAVASSSSGKAE